MTECRRRQRPVPQVEQQVNSVRIVSKLPETCFGQLTSSVCSDGFEHFFRVERSTFLDGPREVVDQLIGLAAECAGQRRPNDVLINFLPGAMRRESDISRT